MSDDLLQLCRKFIDKHKISCDEDVISDRVSEDAYEFIGDIGNIIGFYKEPDEN